MPDTIRFKLAILIVSFIDGIVLYNMHLYILCNGIKHDNVVIV